MESAERRSAESAPRRSGAAFALLAVVQVTLIATITVIAVPLPAIQEEFGLRPMQLVLVSAGYGLAFSGLLLLGGRLADLFGRRRTLVAGLIVFGGASAVAALAPGYATLLGARFAQGCGAALAAPAAMALIGVVFPDPARRARALAAWGVLAGIGATAGLLLSGLMLTWVSWRWAFVAPVLVAAGGALSAPRLLPAGPPPRSTVLDVQGALLVTGGLTALSFGLTQAGEPDMATAAPLTLVAAGALLGAFAIVERRVATPLLPPALLASPRRLVSLGAVTLAAAGHATVLFFLVLYLQQVRDLSPAATSAALLPFALSLLAIAPLAGRLVVRVGPRAAVAAGLGLGAAGLLMLTRIAADPAYSGLLAGLLVFPAGVALIFSGATVAAMDGIDDRQAGVAGGLVNTAIETGPTVGLALLTSLAATHSAHLASTGLDTATASAGGYAFALAIAAAIYVAMAGLALVALRSPRSAAVELSE